MNDELKFYIGEYEGVINKSKKILRTSIESIVNFIKNKISKDDNGVLIVSEIDIFTGIKKYIKKFIVVDELFLIKEESTNYNLKNEKDIIKEILIKMK